MKKSILGLKGVKELSKADQRNISGGKVFNPGGPNTPEGDGCGFNTCRNQFGRCSWSACDRGY